MTARDIPACITAGAEMGEVIWRDAKKLPFSLAPLIRFCRVTPSAGNAARRKTPKNEHPESSPLPSHPLRNCRIGLHVRFVPAIDVHRNPRIPISWRFGAWSLIPNNQQPITTHENTQPGNSPRSRINRQPLPVRWTMAVHSPRSRQKHSLGVHPSRIQRGASRQGASSGGLGSRFPRDRTRTV